MISTEFNYQRRSHRFDLPLWVSIDGVSYKANDWSMTGLGVKHFNGELGEGDTVDAQLTLPMAGSRFTLDVTLQYRISRGDTTGFEFYNLDERMRRVLRQYIELALDGKLERAEDLMSVAATPMVASPIKEALVLSDLEEEQVARSFRFRSALALLVGGLFFLSILAVLFFNTYYRFQTTGLVSGNLNRARAPVSGVVEQIQVRPQQWVENGTPLFGVRDDSIEPGIRRLAQELASIESQLGALPAPAKTLPMIVNLERELAQRERQVAQAEAFLAEGVISRFELNRIKDALQETRTHLDAERAKQESAQYRFTQEYASLQAQQTTLQQLLADLKADQVRPVRATTTGRILSVEKGEGEFVKVGENVVVMEHQKQPNVVFKVRNDEALKLSVGMAAKVYAPNHEAEFAAHISSIGYAAVNAASTDSLEASLGETLVTLSFKEETVRLPNSTRVKVWIKTFDAFW